MIDLVHLYTEARAVACETKPSLATQPFCQGCPQDH